MFFKGDKVVNMSLIPCTLIFVIVILLGPHLAYVVIYSHLGCPGDPLLVFSDVHRAHHVVLRLY